MNFNLKRMACVAALAAAIVMPSHSSAQINGKIDNVDFKLKFNGRLNIDMGTFLGADDDKANRNGITVQDCRLGVIADIDTVWQAKLEISFSNKAVSFRDVYIKRIFKSTGSELQLGNVFMPFGYKRAGLGYKFVETSTSDGAFTPLRKMGLLYQSYSDKFNWGAGFFSDGNIDNAKTTNQGYSLHAYALVRPILTKENVLHFTASGIITHPCGNVSYSAPMPLMFMGKTLVATPSMEAYNTGRLEIAALGIVRRFYAEARFLKAWVNTPNEVYSTDEEGNTVATPQDNYDGAYGFYAQASWRIFGDNQNYNKKTGLGAHPGGKALEVLARFDRTDLDQYGAANTLTLGLNYFANKYIRFRLNYVHASVDDGPNLDALCSRVQFSF